MSREINTQHAPAAIGPYVQAVDLGQLVLTSGQIPVDPKTGEVAVVSWGLEAILSILVPSSSGLAVMSMPIMAPLADFAGLPRELMVTIYQSASGVINLVTPTSGVVMGGLAIAKVPYSCYLRWVAPLLLILIIVNLLILSLSALL